jgi:hypothetical protein
MERKNIDIADAILDVLKDAEYHTITGTTLKVAKYFHLTKKEMNESFESRKDKGTTVANTKIYTQVQLMISQLRKLKYVKDFPGTKNKGIFVITDAGLKLLSFTPSEIKKQINLDLKKYEKKVN